MPPPRPPSPSSPLTAAARILAALAALTPACGDSAQPAPAQHVDAGLHDAGSADAEATADAKATDAEATDDAEAHDRCATRLRPEPLYASLGAPPDPAYFGFEVASPQDVAFVDSPAAGSDKALALTVRPGAIVNGGSRAELSVHGSDPHCQEAWTRWRFMVPDDFTDADPDALRWQIVAQWHDQPLDGAPWEGNSPAIQVQYAAYDARYADAVQRVTSERFAPGDPIVTLSYGVGDALDAVGALKIERGRWYTVTAHTLFSQHADGFAAIWFDDRALVTRAEDGYARGPNATNAAPSYLKLGVYRNPELDATNTVYLDEFSRAATRDALR